jgi:hypothetical protein
VRIVADASFEFVEELRTATQPCEHLETRGDGLGVSMGCIPQNARQVDCVCAAPPLRRDAERGQPSGLGHDVAEVDATTPQREGRAAKLTPRVGDVLGSGCQEPSVRSPLRWLPIVRRSGAPHATSPASAGGAAACSSGLRCAGGHGAHGRQPDPTAVASVPPTPDCVLRDVVFVDALGSPTAQPGHSNLCLG